MFNEILQWFKTAYTMPSAEQIALRELEEAKRTGTMPANNESGCMLRDLYPDLYPKK